MHFTAIVTAAALATMAAASPTSRRAAADMEDGEPKCKYNSFRWGSQISKKEGIFEYGYHHNDDDKTSACAFYEDGDNQQKFDFELLTCKAGDDGRDEVEFKIKGHEDHERVKLDAMHIDAAAKLIFVEKAGCVEDSDFNLDQA